ncbi:MAG: methylmalonyl Co-A mutase-associated GTPase MeaB [Chloroflexi bacterium]|nr:methylmalonyl Co-A mutase-associated GTPase MeaB [Chloroflexota bacterium]
MISAVEAGRSDARRELRHLFALGGKAHVVGITGPPGSGKSTLTTALAKAYRARGETVGVVAVDPSSPFTGGAILGDRIRMMELHDDPGVFVRSMATRGLTGGLARSTMDVVALLDAFGKDVIVVETVGVGQDEVEIARTADSTIVVGVPGLGDHIQSIKAGVLEIADILVVNKADLPGAQQVVNDLRAMLSLGATRTPGWTPPIQETVATTARGIPELVKQIDAHVQFLKDSGSWRARRAENARRQVLGILEDHVRSAFERTIRSETWEARFRNIAARTEDPYAVADELLREVALGDDNE